MKAHLSISILLIFLYPPKAFYGQLLPQKDASAIQTLLKTQESAWNSGDLVGFMKGYWESDSLLFIGKSGVTHGWKSTLANYQKSYPDKAAMGKLTFGIVKMKALGKQNALVIGSWRLDREKDVLMGYFSLTLKKINGNWRIIADHSS